MPRPDADLRHTERLLPVVIGYNYEHVLGKAQVFRRPNGEVEMIVTATGKDGKLLGEYLEQVEPIAMTFIAVPVQNAREKREQT